MTHQQVSTGDPASLVPSRSTWQLAAFLSGPPSVTRSPPFHTQSLQVREMSHPPHQGCRGAMWCPTAWSQ